MTDNQSLKDQFNKGIQFLKDNIYKEISGEQFLKNTTGLVFFKLLTESDGLEFKDNSITKSTEKLNLYGIGGIYFCQNIFKLLAYKHNIKYIAQVFIQPESSVIIQGNNIKTDVMRIGKIYPLHDDTGKINIHPILETNNIDQDHYILDAVKDIMKDDIEYFTFVLSFEIVKILKSLNVKFFTKHLCCEIIKINYKYIEDFPIDSLTTDVWHEIIKQHFLTFQYVPKKLLTMDFWYKCMMDNSRVAKFASKEDLTPDLWSNILKNDPRAIMFVKEDYMTKEFQTDELINFAK